MPSEPFDKLEIVFQLGGPIGARSVLLLECIGRVGSLAQGAKEAGVVYRAAWDDVERLSRFLGAPVVERRLGGAGGGATKLTPLGLKLVDTYRRVERLCRGTAEPLMQTLLSSASDDDTVLPPAKDWLKGNRSSDDVELSEPSRQTRAGERADARARALVPLIAALKAEGIANPNAVAKELEKRQIPTPTGKGPWRRFQVKEVLLRIDNMGLSKIP